MKLSRGVNWLKNHVTTAVDAAAAAIIVQQWLDHSYRFPGQKKDYFQVKVKTHRYYVIQDCIILPME